MGSNQEDMGQLLENLEKTEAEIVKTKLESEAKKYRKLTLLKQEKARELFDMKIFHENEIQNHEKCLEDMKAIYQLNAEKLNYNYKVLQEK